MKINSPQVRYQNYLEDWKITTLKSVLKVNSGRDYKHLSVGDIPVYGTGGYMLSVNEALSEQNAIGIGRKGTIDKPQLLIAPFWTVDTLFFLTPQNNNDISFLYSLLQKINWKNHDESTGVPSLSKVNIEKIKLSIPSFDEQNEIGSFFEKLEKRIALQLQELDILKQMKQGFLQKMFPKEGEDMPDIRFGGFNGQWKKTLFFETINKIIDHRGKTPKKLGLSWSKQGYLALSALNVKNGYIDIYTDAHFGDEKLYKKWMGDYKLKKGQVLFTTEAPMGNVAQVPDDAGYILSQRTIVFETKESVLIDDFLYVLLSSPTVFNKLSSLASGGTAKGVSQKSLSKLNIIIPTDTIEQKRIGEFFKNLDKTIQLQEKELEALKETKKAFLQKMFV